MEWNYRLKATFIAVAAGRPPLRRERVTMSEISKVASSHISRIVIVYVRQSSATQVEQTRESTARQYARSRTLVSSRGWRSRAWHVITPIGIACWTCAR
jgi:hypothetical protein